MNQQSKYKSYLTVLLCVASLTAPALADEPQKTSVENPMPADQTQKSDAGTSLEREASDFHPYNISAEAGTTGFGGTAAWRFSNHFGLCGGADYLSHQLLNNRTISGVSYSGDFTLQSENAGLRYYPSKTSSFFICVGALFNQNVVNGLASGTITIDGVNYDNARLNAQYKQQPICPEATIGGNFFYFDKAHHWSMGGELGVFYLGNPKLTLNSPDNSIPDSALASYQKQAVNDLKKVPVWPVMKLQINFSF